MIFSDESTYFRKKKRRDRVSVRLIWIKIVPPHEHNSRGRSPWTEGVYDTADADTRYSPGGLARTVDIQSNKSP